ncbi:dr1-associated corepressor homolog isoform X2 [Momordica charantia]|uniref:Dr1-associated corepressor homolog isoform X2 n=1 Tax=Momordica charantia TaxID=3673 RepID=A0A6J1C8R2_MOMCH|nr:dr1-associated corepressor homolog isoform X2 [Momordica charantia]
MKQDKLITSWLFSSMFEEILGEMIHCNTAREVWQILENLYTSRNLARVMQLKSKLENIKKGNLPLKDYFQKVKALVDSLAAAGKKVTVEDHIMHILTGLRSEFESTVSVISARTQTQTLQEVYSLLLSHEGRNERNSINTDGTLPSVNLTQQTKNSNSAQSIDGQRPYMQNNRSKNSGNPNFRRNWNSNNRPQCQIYGKFGHTALRCYLRFEKTFLGPNGQSHMQHKFSGGSNSSINSNMTAFGNQQQAFTNGFQPNSNSHMAAFLAQQDFNRDTNWYPDSGATNHVTSNFNNLATSTEYTGDNQVRIGNGPSNWPHFTPREGT